MDHDGEFKEENVFGVLALTDTGESYVSLVGLYDYFWALRADAREKLVAGWIEGLEVFTDPNFEPLVKEGITGDLFTYTSDLVIEEMEPEDKELRAKEILDQETKSKESGTIIPFPTKS